MVWEPQCAPSQGTALSQDQEQPQGKHYLKKKYTRDLGCTKYREELLFPRAIQAITLCLV